MVEIQYDQGRRPLNLEVTRLETGTLVQWRVIQPVWDTGTTGRRITWTLAPYESSTLVHFSMDGWAAEDSAFASVSYKWAVFMLRLKIYMGDRREIASLLPIHQSSGESE